MQVWGNSKSLPNLGRETRIEHGTCALLHASLFLQTVETRFRAKGSQKTLGARSLLGARGLTPMSKKLLGTKDIATRSKDAIVVCRVVLR